MVYCLFKLQINQEVFVAPIILWHKCITEEIKTMASIFAFHFKKRIVLSRLFSAILRCSVGPLKNSENSSKDQIGLKSKVHFKTHSQKATS